MLFRWGCYLLLVVLVTPASSLQRSSEHIDFATDRVMPPGTANACSLLMFQPDVDAAFTTSDVMTDAVVAIRAHPTLPSLIDSDTLWNQASHWGTGVFFHDQLDAIGGTSVRNELLLVTNKHVLTSSDSDINDLVPFISFSLPTAQNSTSFIAYVIRLSVRDVLWHPNSEIDLAAVRLSSPTLQCSSNHPLRFDSEMNSISLQPTLTALKRSMLQLGPLCQDIPAELSPIRLVHILGFPQPAAMPVIGTLSASRNLNLGIHSSFASRVDAVSAPSHIDVDEVQIPALQHLRAQVASSLCHDFRHDLPSSTMLMLDSPQCFQKGVSGSPVWISGGKSSVHTSIQLLGIMFARLTRSSNAPRGTVYGSGCEYPVGAFVRAHEVLALLSQ